MTDRIDRVAQYIEPGTGLPLAVMAIPDSFKDNSPEFVGEPSRMKVL